MKRIEFLTICLLVSYFPVVAICQTVQFAGKSTETMQTLGVTLLSVRNHSLNRLNSTVA
jgi:hypothetical protein